MKSLVLAKTTLFKEIRCDFYRDRDYYPLLNGIQLGQALGYPDRDGFARLLEDYPYLTTAEYSNVTGLDLVEGKRLVRKEARFFGETGIYEVALLSNAGAAAEFQRWVRPILDDFRVRRITREVCRAIRRDLLRAIRDSGLEEEYHQWAYRLITGLTAKLIIGAEDRHYRKKNGPARENLRENPGKEPPNPAVMVEKTLRTLAAAGYDYQESKQVAEAIYGSIRKSLLGL